MGMFEDVVAYYKRTKGSQKGSDLEKGVESHEARDSAQLQHLLIARLQSSS